jgi:hypothetical protein
MELRQLSRGNEAVGVPESAERTAPLHFTL